MNKKIKVGMKSIYFGIIISIACICVHANLNGFTVSIHWYGQHENLYGWWGNVVRHDIEASKVADSTVLYDSNGVEKGARCCRISPDGENVAFITKTKKIVYMKADGSGGLKTLVTNLGTSEGFIQWPHQDWIYYNLGGFEQNNLSRQLKRVNASSGKSESVCNFGNGTWDWAISADMKKAAVRFDDNGSPSATIGLVDLGSGCKVRDLKKVQIDLGEIRTARWMCQPGISPNGKYVMGAYNHGGFLIIDYNSGKTLLKHGFKNDDSAWGGTVYNRPQGNRNNWSRNSNEWICVMQGMGGSRGKKGSNQVLYNWKKKKRITVTNYQEGGRNQSFCASSGDLWVGSEGSTSEEKTGHLNGMESYDSHRFSIRSWGSGYWIKVAEKADFNLILSDIRGRTLDVVRLKGGSVYCTDRQNLSPAVYLIKLVSKGKKAAKPVYIQTF